jgi:hypothetical protein
MGKSKMETTEKLIEMLTEFTGISCFDSGGANGRHFQENRSKDFESEPATNLDLSYEYIDYTQDLYHYLSNRVEYAPELDTIFQEYMNIADNDSLLNDMDMFPKYIEKTYGVECTGIYGEGEPGIINTYNGESNISQGIQFMYLTVSYDSDIEWSGCEYVILQIHGGADCRGGYTDPVVFYAEIDTMFDSARGYICCDKSPVYHPDLFCDTETEIVIDNDIPGVHSWYTDDNYNWYADNDAYKNLNKYEFTDDMSQRGKGVIVTDGGIGYCPICGNKLICG